MNKLRRPLIDSSSSTSVDADRDRMKRFFGTEDQHHADAGKVPDVTSMSARARYYARWVVTKIDNLINEYLCYQIGKQNKKATKNTLVVFSATKPHDARKQWGLWRQSQSFYDYLYILIGLFVARRGYRVGFLFKNAPVERHLEPVFVGERKVTDHLIMPANYLDLQTTDGTAPSLDWTIDIPGKIIKTKGFNYYDAIVNTFRALYKRYTPDFDAPQTQGYLKQMLRTIEVMDDQFERLVAYQRETGNPVKIVGREYHYMPNNVLQELCDFHSENEAIDIEFVYLGRGGMTVFGGPMNDTNIAAFNMTPKKLEEWYELDKESWEEIRHDDAVLEKGLHYMSLATERAKGEVIYTPEEKVLLDTLAENKKSGRRAYVLCAHVPYDSAVHDHRAGFEGQIDWLRTTIDVFRNRDDILILKPHPHQYIPYQPGRIPNETLEEQVLRCGPLPDNIYILSPRLISLNDLLPWVDGALIWISSAGLETVWQGTPTLIAGPATYTSLPLNVVNDKKDYAMLIDQLPDRKVDDVQREAVARYQARLASLHNYISALPFWKFIGTQRYSPTRMFQLLRKGEPGVERLVDVIVN